MTDIYPGISTISAGFNAQLPPINMSYSSIKLIQTQMYNTWAQAEVCILLNRVIATMMLNDKVMQCMCALVFPGQTIAFAEQYAESLIAGFSATASTGQTFSLVLPPTMLALGFPASPSGAGSGYLSPTAVCDMVCRFKSNGTALSLMTWDIG